MNLGPDPKARLDGIIGVGPFERISLMSCRSFRRPGLLRSCLDSFL